MLVLKTCLYWRHVFVFRGNTVTCTPCSNTFHSFYFWLTFHLSAAIPMIVMEFASRGNLLNLLRRRRGASDRVRQQLRRLDSITSNDDGYSTPQGSNQQDYYRYTSYTSMPKVDDLLRPDNVYSFGRQIARGMEFLTARHVSSLSEQFAMVCMVKRVLRILCADRV